MDTFRISHKPMPWQVRGYSFSPQSTDLFARQDCNITSDVMQITVWA
ncbi:hypothetical protein CLV75_4175 [Ruegeria conchae]|uniref:Uncharacterized protein n=1 Tax=Ruegeria conchae TaxID=981384 RepID=A0A497YZL7_9RHOB|nr:hypothetical protein CLV75_4175 [Ruegeria conchae]